VLSEAKRGAHRVSLLKSPDPDARLEALYGEGVKYESIVGIITIAAELEVIPHTHCLSFISVNDLYPYIYICIYTYAFVIKCENDVHQKGGL
jgi:hypothetical protein